MDPRTLGPEQWEQIGRALNNLVLFAGLTVNTAVIFLLAHGIIPSLVGSAEISPAAQVFRRVLYPLFVLSLALTLFVLVRWLSLAIGVLQHFYPRFGI